jgi:hypothetical protein
MHLRAQVLDHAPHGCYRLHIFLVFLVCSSSSTIGKHPYLIAVICTFAFNSFLFCSSSVLGKQLVVADAANILDQDRIILSQHDHLIISSPCLSILYCRYPPRSTKHILLDLHPISLCLITCDSITVIVATLRRYPAHIRFASIRVSINFYIHVGSPI